MPPGLIKVACIPAYNEERTIGKVVVRTLPYVDQVLVCDDRQLKGGIWHRLLLTTVL